MGKKPSRWDKAKSVLNILALLVSILIIVMPFALAVYHRITSGNWPTWSGFGDYFGPTGELVRGKTLWDWMDLLIIPFVLALGAYFFNRSERRNEIEVAEKARQTDREIAADRQNEATLQNYLDKMTDLLLKEKLLEKKDNKDDPIVDVAHVRTVTTIRTLDQNRRNILFQFLRDAKLADFILVETSLGGADLRMADLRGIILEEANLRGANMQEANMMGANLQGAFLEDANLELANMQEANLRGASLRRANLQLADLINADLQGADLEGADLENAMVIEEDLGEVKSLSGAIMLDGEKYDGRFDRKEEEQEGQ